MLTQPGHLRDFLRVRMGKPFHVVYVPLHGFVEEHFEHVGRMALAAKNLILYVDEVDLLCSPNSMKAPDSQWWGYKENQRKQPVLKEILNRGRHQGVAMITMSRFPTQVNPAIRSQASEMRVFRADDPGVVAYFKGKNARLAAMLPTVPDYHYVLLQDGKQPVLAGGKR